MYGPTETTVVATAGWVDPGGTGLPPVGRALPYGYTRVVTPDGALAAPGEQGELWVGGDGVATGYANAPRQTAARFVADPHAEEGALVYRTGDLVQLDNGGRLHYSGRRDRQFKLAGVRFELGETEAVALRRPGVEQAVALTTESAAGPRLHLFVTLAAGTDPDATDEAIRAALPAQLRHLTIHHPDGLPYNSSGKVDQRRLTELAERGRAAGTTAPTQAVPAPAPADATAHTHGHSAALEVLWPALAPLSRRERLDLVHRLIGSVLDSTTAGKEPR
jgi:acyl-CoA synthetase (AMP-forming)/AMP-acid ligase II